MADRKEGAAAPIQRQGEYQQQNQQQQNQDAAGQQHLCCIKQFGPEVFHESSTHFFQYDIGVQSSHLTSLLKLGTQKYLSLRFKI